jgi:hypothetical protein
MNTTKLAAEFANDISRQVEGNEVSKQETEIRTLRDLEMVVVSGGGDAVPCW